MEGVEDRGCYLLKVWGIDVSRAVARCPPWASTETEDGLLNIFFKGRRERDAFAHSLSGLHVAVASKDGVQTHLRTIAKVELSLNGRGYSFENDFGYGYEKSSARFMWTDGNYGCDCNRSLFIQRQCDESFPEMECGDSIELTKLEIELRPLTPRS